MIKVNIIKIAELISPIFYKLVYMSINATIIGIIIFCILKLLKKIISPKIRYIIWFVFILMLMIPIEFETKYDIKLKLPINFANISKVQYLENTSSDNSYINLNTEQDFLLESNFSYQDFELLFPIIWYLVLIIGIIFNIICYEKFNYRLNYGENLIDSRIITILEKCKKKLNIKNNIEIICKNSIEVPAIFGIIKCKILLNNEILFLKDEEIEKVIMHELIHYKRKDNLSNMLIITLKFVYFFNPIVFILLSIFRNEMEFAVDKEVTKYFNKKEKNEYCRILIKLASENSFECVNCLSDNKRTLNSRIEEIKNNFNNKIIRNICLIVISIILIIFMIIVCSVDKKLNINETKRLLEKGLNFEECLIDSDIKYNSKNFQDYQNINNIDRISVKDIKFDGSIKNYITLLNDSNNINLSYKYLKNEKYNNIKCGVISLYSKNEDEFMSFDLWIDLELGVILKEEYYYNNSNNIKPKESIYEIDYTYDYNKILTTVN